MKNISIDPVWEEIFSTREWGQYPSENIIRFVARNYYKKERDNIKILDFGCGGGAHTWYLAREGFDTYAFDGSPSAVESTRKKLIKDSLNADVRVMDGCDLEYESNYFDAVIDSACIYANTLNHIENMYKDIYRILKTGGKLLTTAFSSETTGYGTGKEIEKNTYENITRGSLSGRGKVHFWNDDELMKLLSYVGFKNVRQDYEIYSNGEDIVKLLVVSGEK